MSTKINSKCIAVVTALFMIMTVFAVLPAAGKADVYGATKKGTIKNGPLNVRSNAGTKYKKLGTIAKGKTITIKGTKKDKNGTKWYKFKLLDPQKWICMCKICNREIHFQEFFFCRQTENVFTVKEGND